MYGQFEVDFDDAHVELITLIPQFFFVCKKEKE